MPRLSRSASATRKLRKDPTYEWVKKMSCDEVFAEISRLLESATGQVKPAPNTVGCALTLGGSRLSVSLFYSGNDMHVAVSASDAPLKYVVPRKVLSFRVEEIGSGEVRNLQDVYGDAAAVFDGFPVEQWPEAKFRLLPAG